MLTWKQRGEGGIDLGAEGVEGGGQAEAMPCPFST